jgi:tRNA(fMet)-specific endonuclease VapC
MKSFLIETSVIIDYLKGDDQAKTIIESIKGKLTSSYFCLSELYEGINRVKNPEAHEKSVLSYFSSLTTIYGLDIHIAKKFGELRAKLKKEGNIIEDIDIYIAATCLTHENILVTFNKKHFSHIQDLQIL